MSKKVEFCFVDAKGVHNKVYSEMERDQLKKDIELVEKLRPNAPIRLLGTNKNTGKPLTQYRGQKFDWDNTALTVEITFGGTETYTYVTYKYVEIGDGFHLKTTTGISHGIVASACKRRTINEIREIAKKIGYKKLTVLQNAIVKEE